MILDQELYMHIMKHCNHNSIFCEHHNLSYKVINLNNQMSKDSK